MENTEFQKYIFEYFNFLHFNNKQACIHIYISKGCK